MDNFIRHGASDDDHGGDDDEQHAAAAAAAAAADDDDDDDDDDVADAGRLRVRAGTLRGCLLIGGSALKALYSGLTGEPLYDVQEFDPLLAGLPDGSATLQQCAVSTTKKPACQK